MNIMHELAAVAAALGLSMPREVEPDPLRPRRLRVLAPRKPAYRPRSIPGRCWCGDGVPSKIRTKAQRNAERALNRPGYIPQGGGQGRVR